MEAKDIKAMLDDVQKTIEQTLTAKQKTEIADQLKTFNDAVAEMKGKGAEIDELKTKLAAAEKALADNQPVIDAFVKAGQERKTDVKEKSFVAAIGEAFEAKFDDIKHLQKHKGTITLDLKGVNLNTKVVANMTLGGHLTGDQVGSYLGAGMLAGDTVNLRDFIPTTRTATGLGITYRETGGEGAFARQTEGNSKAQVDYDFTEVKVVQRYIAGTATISRQMLQDLPFLQSGLSRMLLRDFYKKENTLLYANLAADLTTAFTATGNNIPEKILSTVIKQKKNGYTASVVFITYEDWNTCLTERRPSTGTDYALPMGFSFNSVTGMLTCLGTPVIPASWVNASDITVIDNNYIERLEVDGLAISMSNEEGNNFTKNLVTFKAECREDLNALLTAAHLNFGTQS